MAPRGCYKVSQVAQVSIYTHTYTNTYTYTYTHNFTYTYTYLHPLTHTYTYTYTYTYTHLHLHIHTHIHTLILKHQHRFTHDARFEDGVRGVALTEDAYVEGTWVPIAKTRVRGARSAAAHPHTTRPRKRAEAAPSHLPNQQQPARRKRLRKLVVLDGEVSDN